MKKFIEIIKSAVLSIMISFSIFVIVGMIFDRIGNGHFSIDNYGFTKMALACVITGLGFGIPSILYSIEKIPMALSSVIHMGIGFTSYFIVASLVGWIPRQAGTLACIVTVAGAIVIGLIIWVCFMMYYKNLAEKMNAELQKKNG